VGDRNAHRDAGDELTPSDLEALRASAEYVRTAVESIER
jgi:hypothetical protein